MSQVLESQSAPTRVAKSINTLADSFTNMLGSVYGKNEGGRLFGNLIKFFAFAVLFCLVLHWFTYPKGLAFMSSIPLMTKDLFMPPDDAEMKKRLMEEIKSHDTKSKDAAFKLLAIQKKLDEAAAKKAAAAAAAAAASGGAGGATGTFSSNFFSGLAAGGSGISHAVQDTLGSGSGDSQKFGCAYDRAAAAASAGFLGQHQSRSAAAGLSKVTTSSFGNSRKQHMSSPLDDDALRSIAY